MKEPAHAPDSRKPLKHRLDIALVERGLVATREKAQALILAGKVRTNGQRSDKPGQSVAADARLEIDEPLPFVSRGGVKLAAALSHFQISVANKTCMDVGTSTGGF